MVNSVGKIKGKEQRVRTKRLVVASFAAVSSALLVASVAWACTSQARSFGLDALAAPKGTEVRATGEAVVPAGSPLTIRWNSASGPVLAEVTSSDKFTVPLRVPDVAPGVYYLVATSGDTALARAALEVTGDTAMVTATPPQAWSAVQSGSLAVGAPSGGSGVNPSLVIGMGLLSFGAVGLAGGFGVVAVRRRRATVDIR